MILDKEPSQIRNSFPCIISDCEEPGIIVDNKNLTQRRGELGYGFDDNELRHEVEGRTVYYCQPHATKYLFPVIDIVCGYTKGQILADFAYEDLM